MTLRHLGQRYRKLIFLVFAGVLPLTVVSATGEMISEKRMEVAMRMIGHEVLKCVGDHESRILPVGKTGERYRISFEVEFGIDPADIVSIVDRVFTETGTATDYLVEVEQCVTKEVMHSFLMGNPVGPGLIPCEGRPLPKDCYRLMITLLDSPAPNSTTTPSRHSSFTASETEKTIPFQSAFFMIPVLILLGFAGYFMKKQPVAEDPDLILLGASRFDKKSMTLSFADSRVELTNKEAELLSLLHTHANEPVEREVMLREVWGDEGDYVGRTLDVFISKLRKKLAPDTGVKIVNLRGVGYKLVVEGAE